MWTANHSQGTSKHKIETKEGNHKENAFKNHKNIKGYVERRAILILYSLTDLTNGESPFQAT